MARPKGSASKGSAPKASRDKSAKFVELGQKRVAAAIHKIRLLRNLANRGSYDFTPTQVETIVELLTGEVNALRERFEAALKSPGAVAKEEIVVKL